MLGKHSRSPVPTAVPRTTDPAAAGMSFRVTRSRRKGADLTSDADGHRDRRYPHLLCLSPCRPIAHQRSVVAPHGGTGLTCRTLTESDPRDGSPAHSRIDHEDAQAATKAADLGPVLCRRCGLCEHAPRVALPLLPEMTGSPVSTFSRGQAGIRRPALDEAPFRFVLCADKREGGLIRNGRRCVKIKLVGGNLTFPGQGSLARERSGKPCGVPPRCRGTPHGGSA
jgi:hypothetical protein